MAAQPQVPDAASDVFAVKPTAEAQAWLDDAVVSYNDKMTVLRQEWLVNVSDARTDIRRRRVIFSTAKGDVVFNVKSIGGLGKPGDQFFVAMGLGQRHPAAELSHSIRRVAAGR